MFEKYQESSNVDALAVNAGRIAYHSFEWQYTTLMLFNASYIYAIEAFTKIYNKNIKLYDTMETVPGKCVAEAKQFVVFVNDITHTEIILDAMKKQHLNTNSRFILICSHSDECDESRAVKLLWHHRIVNVVFLKYENFSVSAYTYFLTEHCDNPTLHRLQHWENCIESRRDNIHCKNYTFPLKFKNFHRCPLVVSTFLQIPYMYINNGVPYGSDGDLLRHVADALNATLSVILPEDDDGWVMHENPTWTGSFGNVYNDMANFSMTSATITLHQLKYFDISMNYNLIDLVWVTHPSEFEYSSFKLVRPLQGRTKELFFLIFLILLIMNALLKLPIFKTLKKRFDTGISSDDFLIYTLQICIGFSVRKYPKNLYKCVFLFWLWYWFLVRTLYQVYLIGSLQKDMPANTFHTITDAIEEGYQFGSGQDIKEFYVDEEFMYKNWITVNNNEIIPTLVDLSEGKKFVLAIHLVKVKMFEKETHLSLYILPKKILRIHSVLFFKKNSCLAQSVNLVLTRLFEAGIPDKIFDDYTYIILNAQNRPQKLLTLKHIAPCFVILISGYILSITVFIFEKLIGTKDKTMKIIFKQ